MDADSVIVEWKKWCLLIVSEAIEVEKEEEVGGEEKRRRRS